MEQTVQDQIAAREAALRDLRSAFGAYVALVLSSPIDHPSEGPTHQGISTAVPLIAALDAQLKVQERLIDAGVNDALGASVFVLAEGPEFAVSAVDALIAEVVSRVGHLPAGSPLAKAFRL